MDVHRIFVFFFLMFLDEEVARRASIDVFRELQRKNQSDGNANGKDLVQILHSTFVKHQKRSKKNLQYKDFSAVGVLKRDWDLTPWLQFRKQARDEEVEATIYAQIMAVPDQEIASSLRLSIGTVRNRRLQGLLKLSPLLHNHSQARLKAQR